MTDPLTISTTEPRDEQIRERWVRERNGWKDEANRMRLEREIEMSAMRDATLRMEKMVSTLDRSIGEVQDVLGEINKALAALRKAGGK